MQLKFLNNSWLYGLTIGILIGASAMYAGLSLADRIHKFPHYAYLPDGMNQPIPTVNAAKHADSLSDPARIDWPPPVRISLDDGRTLIAEVNCLPHFLLSEGVTIIPMLQTRFHDPQAEKRRARHALDAREAWAALPVEVRETTRATFRKIIIERASKSLHVDSSCIKIVNLRHRGFAE